MEDLPQLEQNPTQKVNKSSQPRGHNRSLSQSQIQKEVHIPVQSHPDIDALFQARTKQQQNLLLAQERERKNKGILKRELEDKDISEGIEEVTVTSDPQTGEEEEGGSPQVVGVQDEVEGSGWLCCWGVRVRFFLSKYFHANFESFENVPECKIFDKICNNTSKCNLCISRKIQHSALTFYKNSFHTTSYGVVIQQISFFRKL